MSIKLKVCAVCVQPYPATYTSCPHCGGRQYYPETDSPETAEVILAVVSAFAFTIAIVATVFFLVRCAS